MAPLASLTITRVAGFSVYQNAKYALDTLIEDTTGKSPLKLVNTPGTFPDWSVVTCFTTAGAISGAACTFLVSKCALGSPTRSPLILLQHPLNSLKTLRKLLS